MENSEPKKAYEIEPILLERNDYLNLLNSEMFKSDNLDNQENSSIFDLWENSITYSLAELLDTIDQKTNGHIYESFEKLYDNLIKQNVYFYGCTTLVYKKNYQNRLKSYIEDFTDSNEIRFIEYELSKGLTNVPYVQISSKSKQRIDYSLRERLDFLAKRAENLGFNLFHSLNENPKDQSFKLKPKKSTESNSKNKRKISEMNWFKVGLLFATGEIKELFEKDLNATDIAKLKFPNNPSGFRPYISGSRNEDKDIPHPKNIFRDPEKILSILNYCEENQIEITQNFKNLKQT